MARLSGWQEIATYTKRSEATLRKWRKTLNFPVISLGGCIESDTILIDRWFLHTAEQLLEENNPSPKPGQQPGGGHA